MARLGNPASSAAPLPDPGLDVRSGPRSWTAGLRTTEGGLLALALVVGAGAGLGAIAFRHLIDASTRILSGHEDYSVADHAAHPWLPGLGSWFVVLAPVVAGLIYGPLVHRFAREARGHGVPEVMYAVAQRGGRMAPQVAAVKALASALCIGGGGSVGREGPIVQIGSALGSTVGRLVHAPEARMRVLVACGAAGGIAATFNTPMAGVFFAMELVLADFAARSFGMVVLASVTASVIGRAALGNEAFLQLPTFEVDHLVQFAWFGALGVLAGAVGVVFTRVLYAVEDACDAVWKGPEWLRPAAGGLLLGLLLLVLPQMYGVGYPVLGNGVAGKYAVGFLLLLLVGKMLATSLTIGIGGSGGVFAPSLFIGAMLGAAFGQSLQVVAPDLAGPAGAYALIGMGAVFAGAARAPITAVIIMFELTGEYTIILPMMAAIVLATGVSHFLTRDTIYTLKLRRRGIDLTATQQTTAVRAAARPVSAVMGPVPQAIGASTPLMEAAGILELAHQSVLPVVDADGAYAGSVTARSVTDALARGVGEDTPVGDVTERLEVVGVDDLLDDAIALLHDTEAVAVPVLDASGHRLVGWLTPHLVLAALHSRDGDRPAAGVRSVRAGERA